MTRSLPKEAANGPFVRRSAALIALFLALVRLRIGAIQSITALGTAVHDDALFLRLAGNIASGQWLGKYDEFTLAKGPFYSIWIATCFTYGVPLLFGEHLLYVASCAFFIFAISPVFKGTFLRLALFAILLFNPVSFADGPMSRVVREGIYPAQALLVLGSVLGLTLRIEKSAWSLAGWGTFFGVNLSAYWLSREERIWIVPAVLVVVAFAASRRPPWRRALAVAGLSLATFGYSLHEVQERNQSHYGTRALTEFTAGSFPEAYETLIRAQDTVASKRAPLRTETRQRIYAVSPHFAELKKYLEGKFGRGWKNLSCAGEFATRSAAGASCGLFAAQRRWRSTTARRMTPPRTGRLLPKRCVRRVTMVACPAYAEELGSCRPFTPKISSRFGRPSKRESRSSLASKTSTRIEK